MFQRRQDIGFPLRAVEDAEDLAGHGRPVGVVPNDIDGVSPARSNGAEDGKIAIDFCADLEPRGTGRFHAATFRGPW